MILRFIDCLVYKSCRVAVQDVDEVYFIQNDFLPFFFRGKKLRQVSL